MDHLDAFRAGSVSEGKISRTLQAPIAPRETVLEEFYRRRQLFVIMVTIMDNEDADALQGGKLNMDSQGWKKNFDHKKHLWESLAGDSLPALLKNRESTEKALLDANPKMRMAGICLLCGHWPRRPGLRSQLEKLATEDSDLQVRAVAIINLGSIHHGTNNQELGARFAGLVRDDLQSARLRWSAYSALLSLRGLSLLSPIVQKFNEHLRGEFPAGCDWDFVDSFLEKETGH